MIPLPDWLIPELTAFASGERSWDAWGNWLAVSAARLSRDLPKEWFSRIKSNPEVDVIRLLMAAGVTVTPHLNPVIVSHPLDNNPHFKAVMRLADKLVEAEVGDVAFPMGGCHALWAARKRILKSEFGLDWESPADLNPDMCFD